MPYVNIKITREGTAPGASSTTPEQKAALIKGVSDLLFEVLGKPRSGTFVVIDEVELENWGVGGLPVPEYRKQLSEAGDKAK
jgi:4-oxalocrotonate tautomerase